MFNSLFKNKTEQVNITVDSIYKGHHHVTYRGIKAIRCPFDYVIYQMIISEVRPDLVIEIGTNIGGGALYIADLMDNIGHGIVHTIDIASAADALLKSHPRIKLFTAGWEGYDISEAKGYQKILVIEDASHMYQDTLDTLVKFAPLVSKDSYLIVEDGIINELGMEKEYKGGPLKAIREFTEANKDFEIDRKWCDMFGTNATFNVNGYLKRK
jgi:cephalosporin hydroxylase